ncbi:MAG: CDP-alcohol phosphatidyltransferase family protein [Candidatus Bathyarchaeota archaeon]|nr:CDP-alcohol phosphatidyltransferase family protein [Candidatus Bathyarchaeota archaeon]
MNKNALIPSGISSLRLAALPIFFYFNSIGSPSMCLLVFALAAGTDLLDGFIARKLKVASKKGAYFDAVVDFLFVAGIFTAFIQNGYYPAWIFLVIAASFVQFVVSGFYTKKLYDPLGKYIGSVLYIAIILTLLAPTSVVFAVVEVGFPIWAGASFITRTLSFTANYRRSLLLQKNLLNQPHQTTRP